MRIECENCRAVYTIGDTLLSDQPIGAQCPYCGHVQMVQKPGGAPAGAGEPSRPSMTGFGSAGPTGLSGLPGDALNTTSASMFSGASVMPTERFGSSGTSGGPGAGFRNDSSATETHSAAKCQVCSTVLTDEFDKVIGLCETHQRERSAQSEFGGEEDAREWQVRLLDGSVLGPFTLNEVKNKISSGELDGEAEYAKGDTGEFRDISSFLELRALGKNALAEPAGTQSGTGRPKLQPRSSGPSISFGTLLTLVVVIGLVGAGAWVAMEPSRVEDLLALLTPKGPRLPQGTNPLRREIAGWRSAHNVSGTVDEHLSLGRNKHLDDTWRGYKQAQDSFQRALLLDEENATALGSYIENLVIWKEGLLNAEELRLANATLKYAQSIEEKNLAVLRGLAALALVRSDLNGCRDYAELALEVAPTDGQAKLLLAGSFLAGNYQLAASKAEAARASVPRLRRVDRVLGVAYASMGRYAASLALLDDRLKSDGKNAAVLSVLGDVERELARFDRAERAYHRAISGEGDTARAQLQLGALYLETGQHGDAARTYRAVTQKDTLPVEYRAEAYTGWGRAELLMNQVSRADRLAGEALRLAPRDASALLLKAETSLEAGSSSTAVAMAQRSLQSRGGEPAALIVLGRAMVARNQIEAAEKFFEEAVQNDPRDPRLRGILAGMYLSHGGTTQAFTVMRRAAETDPLERDARHRKGLLRVSERAVFEAVQRFQTAAAEERNRSVSYSSIGMMYYQLGDNARARAAIERALHYDDSNVTAILYAAQIALERGQSREALLMADRILRLDRGSALGFLLRARVKAKIGKAKDAREDYGNALRSNPGLLSAEVELAGLDFEAGNTQKALAELQRAHRVYPHMLETRRLLLKAGF